MSMWLSLAKIEPALLSRIRDEPELVDALFDEEAASPSPEFRGAADTFGCDYRWLSEIAEGKAQAEHGTTAWREVFPWLAKASGHDCPVIDKAYDFGYGPAHFLTPEEVKQIAEGLAAEGWDTRARWDGDDSNSFADLPPFFVAAAAEGKCVVGGVS